MDRNLFRIGDLLGLTILAFAIGEILSRTGFPNRRYMITVILVAVIFTGIMHRVWLYQSVPDSAYPFWGTASLLGYVHLPYFAGHIAWILLGLRQVVNQKVWGFTLLALLGGGIWLATLVTA